MPGGGKEKQRGESAKRSVLITGATGNQGGALARVLLRKGHLVHALTRRTDSPAAQELEDLGAELMAGDFDDAASLERAAKGMDTVFALSTFFEAGVEAETRQGINVADAAKAAGVKHLIYSSVSDADRNTGVPHFDSKYEVEKHIEGLGIPYTIVAPVFFMENLLSPLSLPALQQGSLAIPMPADRKLQQVALSDLGEFDASVVEERERFLGKRVNIASDEFTGAEAAEILSRVAGRDIRFSQIPIEQVGETSEDFALMYEWFDRVGYSADIPSLRRDRPEVGWHTFEDWAKGQDWSVLDSSYTQ